MSCPEGSFAAGWVCSGDQILRTEPHGNAVLRSGVQAYGKATVDLESGGIDAKKAEGLGRAVGGVTQFRLQKGITAADDGKTLEVRMMLRDLGLSFTGAGPRPPIIDVFRTDQGRSIDPGAITIGTPAIVTQQIPLPIGGGFFDGATEGNYATNRYYPRTEIPLACVPVPKPPATCPPVPVMIVPTVCTPQVTPCPPVIATETKGLDLNESGTFRSNTNLDGIPDQVTATRLHEDGDREIPTVNVDPGSKGIRDFRNYGFYYANLAAWFTDDVVNIDGWRGAGVTVFEHTKNRRGTVAYGVVTDPATVPTVGSATYSDPVSLNQSKVWAWFTPDGSKDAIKIQGKATVVADFATRLVTVEVRDMASFDPKPTDPALPTSFTVTIAMGNSGDNTANYMTGSSNITAASQTLSGGMSARFFGPVGPGTTPAGGNGPAEVGGTFTFSSTTGTKAAIVGGFIARK